MVTAPRSVLITGITGQDGYYLSRLLIDKGCEVHGLASASSPEARLEGVVMHAGDLTDGSHLDALLDAVRPSEVYHFAALSSVGLSFELPLLTANITGMGTVRMLEAVRQYQRRSGQGVRFFHASSSEVFGTAAPSPQDETTPFHPRSPYACAKAFAHWQTVNYREAYGLFACNGILFSHESPRRGEAYVTRKITRAAARIKLGLEQTLKLGNLDAGRDWGFAGDYVEAVWLMLQQDQPDDYVIATGETHTVREFVAEVFGSLDLDWREHVEIDPKLLRPADAAAHCGNAGKARRVLGWEPKVTFRELARMMAEHDLALAQREKLLSDLESGGGTGGS